MIYQAFTRHLADAFIQSDIIIITFVRRKRNYNIDRCRYSKDVNINKCQALTIAKLTHFPYTTNIATIVLLLRCQEVWKRGVGEKGTIRGSGGVEGEAAESR